MPLSEAASLPIRFVLLSPHNSDNVGAAARALKNFGFADWAIVSPPPSLDLDRARRLAVHASDLIDSVKISQSFDEAISDRAFVVGTSSRHVSGRPFLGPEEWASEVSRLSAGGGCAIVFGEERSGMSNEQILRCHALSGIPTLPSQPSLNLAQAVLLYAYEARRASLARCRQGRQQDEPEMPPLADDDALFRLERLLCGVLIECGFARQTRLEKAVQKLLSPLLRGHPFISEGRLWEAALHVILRALKR